MSATAARTVRFPADRSLGTLRVLDMGALSVERAWHWRKSPDTWQWQVLGEARGEVTVPPGMALRLFAREAALDDPSLLASLGPGDLQSLGLRGPRVTDATLQAVGRLTGLVELDLFDTAVDAGLAHLHGLRGLRKLDASRTVAAGPPGVSDAGAEHLRHLVSLEWLGLRGTRVGDATLAALEGLGRLQYLDLRATGVTDAGLAHLRGLTELRYLDLSYAEVRGPGLTHLEGLHRLEVLRLHVRGALLVNHLARLKRALPRVDILH